MSCLRLLLLTEMIIKTSNDRQKTRGWRLATRGWEALPNTKPKSIKEIKVYYLNNQFTIFLLPQRACKQHTNLNNTILNAHYNIIISFMSLSQFQEG